MANFIAGDVVIDAEGVFVTKCTCTWNRKVAHESDCELVSNPTPRDPVLLRPEAKGCGHSPSTLEAIIWLCPCGEHIVKGKATAFLDDIEAKWKSRAIEAAKKAEEEHYAKTQALATIDARDREIERLKTLDRSAEEYAQSLEREIHALKARAEAAEKERDDARNDFVRSEERAVENGLLVFRYRELLNELARWDVDLRHLANGHDEVARKARDILHPTPAPSLDAVKAKHFREAADFCYAWLRDRDFHNSGAVDALRAEAARLEGGGDGN